VGIVVAHGRAGARSSLSERISGQADLRLAGTFETSQDTWRCLRRHPPELLLLDEQLPETGGMTLLRRIGPDAALQVILLTDGVFSGALEPSAAQARRGEIPVFAIGVDAHSPDSGSIYSTLDAMAAESGGRTHAFPSHAETAISDLVGFFEEVETRVRGQYTLGYRRPDTSMPSPLHAVRIRTLDPELRVAVRPATVLTR
jgi:chemotaxis response regulator CheB